MRRLAPSLAALLTLVLLAACGGGGGGGSAPVVPPQNPAPGPTATANPTAAPSGSPTAAPSPSAMPSGTPSAAPSATPAPVQTPTPTPSPLPSATPTPVPPATPSPAPTATGSPAPTAYSWELAGGGALNGMDDQIKTSAPNSHNNAGEGDLEPGDPGAMPQGGGQGPVGNSIDGTTCDTAMSDNYHIHAFIGLFVNGQQIAIPDAVGIVNPGGEFTDSDGWPNQEIYGDCFYHLHTHDASGLVHIEDPDPSGAPITASLFSTKNFFDIWGLLVTPTQFGPFAGPVTVYTSGQFSRDHNCAGNYCEVGSNSYTQWTGDPSDIPLYSHEVIWYEVGSNNPDAAHLPGINFDITQ